MDLDGRRNATPPSGGGDVAIPSTEGEFWLFGYGSLIWKPPPHYDRRIPGWVRGYVRRFWQDHRGTPEAPGRVVTLIERSYWERLTDHHGSAPDRVWGTAYRIEASRIDEVKEYLDIREINGYTIHYAPFYAADGSSAPFRALVYIGTPDNDQFTGPQEIQALAEHIHRSVGPSGLNKDYLWGLEAALDELSPESGDEHVTDLSSRVRAIEQDLKLRVQEQQLQKRNETDSSGDKSKDKEDDILRSPPPVTHRHQTAHHPEFQKSSSIDEQEETEKTC